MEDRAPLRPHSLTLLTLPHFDYAVPLLDGPDGLPYVPISALCRLLGLSVTDELQRARHILLWDSACLLPLPRGASRASATHADVLAWCLSYPLPVGYWFGQVKERVRDSARRGQLQRAFEDALHLGGRAHRLVQTRYQVGRTAVHALARDLTLIDEQLHHLRERSPAADTALNARFDAFALRHLAALEQARTFVQDWLGRQKNQPVIDGILVDQAGNVQGEPVPFAVFGTFGEEDESRLLRYQEVIDQVQAELDALRREVLGPDPS